MKIEKIHSYLVHPGKGLDEQLEVKGTEIPLRGTMYNMLRDIFDKSPDECKHDIAFTTPDGKQQNDCRDLVLAHITKPTTRNGHALAERLQGVTTNRSGLGLMFLMIGSSGNRKRLVISRFPADNGFLAIEQAKTLDVEFVERIFLKSSRGYKSAMYEGASTVKDFWEGKAIDRQIKDDVEIPEYWIKEFLLSDFSTTGERGTRTLAAALRDAINDKDVPLNVKDEISSAVKLSRNLDKKLVSPVEYGKKLNLSQAAQNALLSKIRTDLHQVQFQLSVEELDKLITFKTIELDNGAYMSALASKFDDVFDKEPAKNGQTTFSTTGAVVDERIRKKK